MNQRSHELELKRLLDQTSWAARLARTLVGPEGADDLLQEAWVQTLAHPPEGGIESPRAWLATILRRGAAREGRARGRRTDRERRAAREEALPSTHALRAREEDRRILVEAVLELPELTREPLVLRYFEELSPSAIAERLGVPSSTVRSRLQRGLEALREKLERERGEDWRAWCLGLLPAGAVGGPAEKALAGKLVLAGLALAAAVALLVGFWPFGPAESSSDGNAALTGLRPAAVPEVEAHSSAPVSTTDDRREAVESDSPPESEESLVPTDPRVYVVRGLCLDEAKHPVAGVRAVAADLFGTPSAVSGPDGRFVLPLEAPSPLSGPWQSAPTGRRASGTTLLFAGERHRAGMERIELGAEREVDIGTVETITAPRSVRGRVITASGSPAGGALVYLLKDFELGSAEAALSRCAVFSRMMIHIGAFGCIETDRDGRFQLAGVPAGAFRLSLFSNGHDGLLTATQDPELGDSIDLGILQLEACDAERAVSGRVVTAAGDGVPGAWVLVRSSVDGGQSSMQNSPIVADADGFFRVPVPAEAVCRLRVESPLGTARDDGVTAGTVGLMMELEPVPAAESSEPPPVPLPRVRGSVSFAGAGVPGAWVTAWKLADDGRGGATTSLHTTAESGAEGRFEIAVPDDSSCLLRAGFGPWDAPLFAEWGPAALQPDEERGEVELELSAAGSIAGELVGAGAVGMTGTTVRARREGWPPRTATVGGANEFRFDSLAPGRYRLTRDTLSTSADETEEVVVEVESGLTARARFDLAGEIPCRLVGRLSIDEKRPRGTWKLTIEQERSSPPSPALDREGSFVVEPLEPGWLSWLAVCRSNPPQYFHQELEIVAGENRVDVDLRTGRLELEGLPLPDQLDPTNEAGLNCSLTWEGADGLKWAAYLVQAKQGALTLRRVPAGTIQLRYQERGTQAPENAPVVAEVVVRAGETAKLTFPPQ